MEFYSRRLNFFQEWRAVRVVLAPPVTKFRLGLVRVFAGGVGVTGDQRLG